jgi:hypothetical protein
MAAIFTFLPSSIERLAKPGRPSMLPALSLCTCCRHYPGAATGGTALLIRPVMPAFPGLAAGSARASTFSRFAQRSLALRPAHSRGHQFVARLSEGFNHFVSSIVAPVLPAGAVRRVGLSPTGKRRLITAHASCRRWASPYNLPETSHSRARVRRHRGAGCVCGGTSGLSSRNAPFAVAADQAAEVKTPRQVAASLGQI